MAEGVGTQITEAPGKVIRTIKNTPVLAFVIGVIVLTFVLLFESFKPGVFTGPIRSGLAKIGVKQAA